MRPYDQAALLAAGILSIEVFKKPRVLIIPTGDEIVRPEDAPSPLPKGALLEVNGQMLASLAAECGAEAEILKPVPNVLGELKSALEAALAGGYDLVMLIAGSSAGSEDFTPALLEGLGELLVHGITVMPGKPALLAAVDGRPVVGIPGYPVSAAVAFREFARPLLFIMQGLTPPEYDRVEVTVGRKIPSKLGLEEHVRVILGNVGGKAVAMPIAGGAGVITSIVRADGIIRIPQEVSGLSEGEKAYAELLGPREAMNDRLLAIGSHDLTIDLLNSLLKEKTGGRIHISSSNVGSLGGLLAVKRQTAHFAGSHLLDTATGDYNLSYIRRYLPDMPVALVTLVHRWQGFMVPAGNPKKIEGIGDLARPDVVFVNRQSGSGTRILLDYELAKGRHPAGAHRRLQQRGIHAHECRHGRGLGRSGHRPGHTHRREGAVARFHPRHEGTLRPRHPARLSRRRKDTAPSRDHPLRRIQGESPRHGRIRSARDGKLGSSTLSVPG